MICQFTKNRFEKLILIISLTLGLTIFTSCASENGKPYEWIQDGDLDIPEEEVFETTDEEASIDEASGIWGLKFSIAFTTVLPVFNRKVQMVVVGVAILATDQDELTLDFTEHVCDFTMNIVEDIDFHITFPEATIKSIPVRPRVGYFSELEPGATFNAGPVLDVYGAEDDLYGDPFTDSLPTEPDDPVVLDFEEDGNPGLTGRVSGIVSGEVYVVMRLKRTLDGIVINGSRIEGSIVSEAEMVTLAADPFVLEFQLEMTPHPVPELNVFEMIRISPDVTCDELFNHNEDYFTIDPLADAVPLDEDER